MNSGIAPQDDVGAAAGHVGRDRDGALATRLGHDLGLALVFLGVQDLVVNPVSLEQVGSSSDFSIDTVPTEIGRPVAWTSLISSRIACVFSCSER